MSSNLVVGLLATFIPLFTVGYLMLNKKPPIFRMFVAMLLVGLGYLTATGAVEDIGTQLIGVSPASVPAPAEKEAAKPAADAAPVAKEAAPAGAEPKPAQ